MHLTANGFAVCMVGVVKRLMDKSGKESLHKPTTLHHHWTSCCKGKQELQSYHCYPNTCTHNMHNVHQEMIRRQGNKPEIEYSVIDPGTPVYAQNSREERWHPTTVIKPADALDSY